MTTAESYFLTVVKHQSITRAADALFLSRQNLSNYMKKLEEDYGLLFIRKPRFQLTPTGEALYETLRQIEILESSFQHRLQDLKQSEHGTFRIGMHASRAQVIMPELLPRFRERYPDINLVLHEQDNVYSRQMLANGDLDLYLGVDAPRSPEFHYEFLEIEPIRLAVSASLLRSRGLPEDLEEISCELLPHFPLIANPYESNFRNKIDQFYQRMGITSQPVMVAPDFYLQLLLAARGVGICFYPQSMRRHIEHMNCTFPADAQLRQLSVVEMNETAELTIVTHRLSYPSHAFTAFCHLLRDVVRSL